MDEMKLMQVAQERWGSDSSFFFPVSLLESTMHKNRFKDHSTYINIKPEYEVVIRMVFWILWVPYVFNMISV